MVAMNAKTGSQMWYRDIRDIGERDKCPGQNVPHKRDIQRDIRTGTKSLSPRSGESGCPACPVCQFLSGSTGTASARDSLRAGCAPSSTISERMNR